MINRMQDQDLRISAQKIIHKIINFFDVIKTTYAQQLHDVQSIESDQEICSMAAFCRENLRN